MLLKLLILLGAFGLQNKAKNQKKSDFEKLKLFEDLMLHIKLSDSQVILRGSLWYSGKTKLRIYKLFPFWYDFFSLGSCLGKFPPKEKIFETKAAIITFSEYQNYCVLEVQR